MKACILLFSFVLLNCSGLKGKDNQLIHAIQKHFHKTFKDEQFRFYLDKVKLDSDYVYNTYDYSLININNIESGVLAFEGFEKKSKNQFLRNQRAIKKKSETWEKIKFYENQEIRSISNTGNYTNKDLELLKEISFGKAKLIKVSDFLYNDSYDKAIVGVSITEGLNISRSYVLVLKKENKVWEIISNLPSSEIN